MNQSKAFLTSLIFAGLAMLLVYAYVNQKETEITVEYGTPVSVVIASRDINEFEEIQDNMLRVDSVPLKFAQPGSYELIKSGDKEVPKSLTIETFTGSVASSPIKKGEQVLMTKVLLKGSDTGLAAQVAISRRAVSIPVSDITGVTKLLKPGDRVDIISNVQYKAPGGQDSEVKTLLQNIHILGVGEVIQNKVPAAFERDPITGIKRAVNLRGSRVFNTVTIEVTPQEAQTVIWSLQNGSELFLALRNPVDRVIASVPTTTVDEVLGPNSKKAEKDRARLVVPKIALPSAPLPPPAPNPWATGGGSFK